MNAPDLVIRLKHHSDGSASITCVRRDGTITWQRQSGSRGLVFPPHDITHFVVESELGYSDAFYGLIADGWRIEDFAKPWPRGEIPQNARRVEVLVGCFDAERRNFSEWTAAEFNAHATVYAAASRSPDTPIRLITDDELGRLRARLRELLATWHALPRGESMKLEFPAS